MKKRKWLSLWTLVVFCTTLWPTTLIAAPQSDGSEAAPKNEQVSLIVELEGLPVLAQESAKTHGARAYVGSDAASKVEADILHEQAEVLADIASLIAADGSGVATTNHKGSAKDAPRLVPTYSYTHVLNGFSIECDSALMDDIQKLPGVKGVYKNKQYQIVPPEQEEKSSTVSTDYNDMNTAYLHDQNIRGQGQVVAVIDSELDVQHEMFAGEVANPALSKADVASILKNQHLNIDASVDEVYRSSKMPFVYNYASQSPDTYSDSEERIHGTHVSGIAAGRNGHTLDNRPLSGTAPEAQLLFFAVSQGASGSMYNDAIFAALDDCIKLGADVINTSFGNIYGYYDPLDKETFSNIEKAGIFVAASANNSDRHVNAGQSPLTPDSPDYSTLSSPASLDSTTAVASADVSSVQYKHYKLRVDGTDEIVPFVDFGCPSIKLFFHDMFSDKSYDTVYCGNGSAEECAEQDLTGKIAVIHLDFTSVDEIYDTLMKKGAVGVIFIHYDDVLTYDEVSTYELPLPTALVLPEEGALLTEGHQRISIDATDVQIDSVTADSAPSFFSSWGVLTDLRLNPDISAPGNIIYSSLPSTSHDQYIAMSGTSMASPHIAGAAALLKQYIQSHPSQYTGLYSQAPLNSVIKNLMMSTATVMTDDNGLPYSPRNQGAGLVNLQAAAETPVILLGDQGQSKVSLGNNIGDTFTFSFTAQNLSNKDVTYDALHLSVYGDDVAEDGWLEGVCPLETTDIDLPDAVTVPVGGNTTIDVTVKLDKAAMKERMKVFKNGFFVDGYVTLSSTDDSVPDVHLPYTGFYGDWTAMTAMDAPYYSKDSILKMTGLISTFSEDKVLRLGSQDLMATMTHPELTYDDLSALPVNEHAADYSALSPNGDGLMDDLIFLVRPLREMADPIITLKDSNGKVLYEQQESITLFKAWELGLSIPQDVLDALPEGNYEVTFTSHFNYEGSKDESLTLPFAVDLHAPKIEKWKMNENGTLTITAKDDRALIGAIAAGIDADGNEQIVTADTTSDTTPEAATLSLDVSTIDPASLEVIVLDYAGNTWTGYGKDGRPFADVPTDAWYADAVDYVSSNGLMVGIEDGKFAPMMTTTRAQLATTLWRLAGEPEATHSADFSDVSDTAYYTDAVAWAAEEGIAAGFGDGKFHPNDALSREQLAAFLMKFADASGLDTDARENLSDYKDVKKSDWSYDPLSWAKAEGLLGGTTATTMQPKATANRAQLAAVLQRYCTNMATS
ncbi:MAG: S8 family serine peptidase [Peptococcaceae bacterium]